MTFISTQLRLDLPLHEPKEGLWHDESGNEYNATPNEHEHCVRTTLDKLGSCLQLNSGGQLTLSSPIAGTEGNLTVEFWTLPDDATRFRQILGGPLAVWMGNGKLQWSIGGANPKALSLPEPAVNESELHHWAIVVHHADTDFPFHVYRDGIELQGITATDNESTSSEAGSMAFVIGGAADTGWTGKLAHLRIWAAALTAQDLKKNMQRDISAHAAFKASTGIEWQLLNTNDEPSLYIQGSQQQVLRLEMKNVTKKTTLVIPASNAEASFDNRHFQLVFRPGTIASIILQEDAFANRIENYPGNEGWRITKGDWDGQDCLFFLWVGTQDIERAYGESFQIYLPGLAAEPGAGSRTTRVMLTYKNIQLKSDDSCTLLDGHRAQLLNIIYRDPSASSRRPPFEVGVVGAPAILNNGTETCLTLYIKNLNRNEDGAAAAITLGSANASADRQPKFVLEIDTLTDDAKGLADLDDLTNTEVKPIADSPITIDEAKASGSTVRWEIKPTRNIPAEKVGFNANETALLTLAGLKTAAPPGRSVLRLRYEDFDGYGEGVFEIPVDRVPAVPAKLRQGGAGYGLAIGHDPRVGQNDPNAEVLNEALSVKQMSGGDAVRIENTGSGSGLSVIQHGSAPAAKFSGGSGVEIKGNLLANGDAEITGALQVNERIRDKTGEVMPVGTVVAYAGSGSSPPDGWLLCDGSPKWGDGELAELYGVLDDSVQKWTQQERPAFSLPNLKEKFVVGAAGTGEYKLGETGGLGSVTLTEAQMPHHSHGVYDPGHSHKYALTTAGVYNKDSGNSRRTFKGDWVQTDTKPTGITIQGTGRNTAHENRPPFVALNYIIKY